MPLLVHLADERDAAAIRRSGIRKGKREGVVYFMPVLPQFYISHQWLRELKRSGAKTLVGVYFRLDSATKVYAGKYNAVHRHIPLGEAIREIMSLEDPLGYELAIDRKIGAKEIRKIRALPQTIGWRYFPASHSRRPSCGCPVCVPPGSIKGRKLRERLDPPEKKQSAGELLEKIKTDPGNEEICDLLRRLAFMRTRIDPETLAFLLEKGDHAVSQAFAQALEAFRHRNTRGLLLQLLKSVDPETREYAAQSMLGLYGKEAAIQLSKRKDAAIRAAVAEWEEKRK